MFNMAQNGKLVLRMPDKEKQRIKIYQMMEKAAKVDGKISIEEQALLNYIKKQYLNEGTYTISK